MSWYGRDFNRTLKSMLSVKCGNQWDRYLSTVLWAYRNTPHESSGILLIIRI